VSVRAGDAMFLPSGRVHAIGAGLVIFEIQQNSDTTYRVFDWNRVGLDGKPRELHIAQSLASIDFNDFEPALISGEEVIGPNFRSRQLVKHSLFTVEQFKVQSSATILFRRKRMQIIGVVCGKVSIGSAVGESVVLQAGEFCLLPAALPMVELFVQSDTQFLRTEAG
jgi:mannose-6-phosphate isomerase